MPAQKMLLMMLPLVFVIQGCASSGDIERRLSGVENKLSATSKTQEKVVVFLNHQASELDKLEKNILAVNATLSKLDRELKYAQGHGESISALRDDFLRMSNLLQPALRKIAAIQFYRMSDGSYLVGVREGAQMEMGQ